MAAANIFKGNKSEVDVLIIGAGPAGLMACNALASAGVNVRIVDKRPVKVAAGQADGIQPRMVEVFQSYGLADRLLKEGNQLHTAAFYNPNHEGGIELTDRVPDVTAPSARYPFEVTLHQGAIEAIFLDFMRKFGIAVERPITPISIQVSENEKDTNSHPIKARVVLRHLDQQDGQADVETVKAKFVIGADGAHSWVRKFYDIPMEGEQTDYIWGVVDIVPNTDFPDIRNKCVIHSNNGSCMIIPREDDKVRLYIQLGDRSAIDAASGRVNKEKCGPQQLLEVARKSLSPFNLKTSEEEVEWWTIYIIGQRVAAKYSVNDRVFIVGDACHTHSPKAGQGMNASMNDAHNLAWKLVYVLRGWASISLLQTYEFERRKFAQDLIAFDRQFASLFSGKPRTEINQDGVSHEEFLKAFQTFGGFTSGIGIRYEESTITNNTHQLHAKNVTVGQRAPPQVFIRVADSRPVDIQDLLVSDTRFKILIFTGNTSEATRLMQLEGLGEQLHKILAKYALSRDIQNIFDIISISSAKKSELRYNDLPRLLRSHWSKVLTDDIDNRGTQGGNGYTKFGISDDGAIIIVRPDGYVGIILPLDDVSDANKYFARFMRLRV